MKDSLYFPNNLKDIKEFFTIKSNSFQKKELLTTPFLLQQPFVCNWSSIYLRANYRVQDWRIIYEFEKQWLSRFV